MRAVRYERYGAADVAKVVDVREPGREGRGYLVKVHAAALNPKDVLVRKGKFPFMAGRRFPKAMGYDWAGEIVEGDASFPAGTRVFGMIQSWAAGALAELARVLPDECARAPEGLTFEECAALPLASLTALQALRDEGSVGRGHAVLLHGASGGVGVYAIQIAKALGATVTTTSSEKNRELCLSLGADRALDYTAVDFGRGEVTGQPFDAFVDVFGNQRFSRVRRLLTPEGTYVTTVPSPRIALDTVLTPLRTRRRARLVVVRSRRSDLEAITKLVAEGKLRPVIDSTFPLADIREASLRIESKRARGKVVVTVV